MKRIQKTIHLLLAGILLAGCAPEEKIVTPAANSRLVLTVPDASPVTIGTRSGAIDESEIKKVWMIALDADGTCTHAKQYTPEPDSEPGQTVIVIQDNIPINGELPSAAGPAAGDVVYLIANSELIANGETTGSAGLSIGSSLSAEDIDRLFQVTPDDFGTYGVPMYGKVDSWSGEGNNTCSMTRATAKVQLNIAPGLFDGKTVTATLQNTPVYGRLIPGTEGNLNTPPLDTPGDLKQVPLPTDGTHVFLPEWSNNAADDIATAPCLLLTVTDNPADIPSTADATDTAGTADASREYYRLDFHDGAGYLDIVRNHSYTFSITSVKSAGYATPEAALALPGSNIGYTVSVTDDWALSITSNGQYAVVTDKKEISFDTAATSLAQEIRIAANVPAGLQAALSAGGEVSLVYADGSPLPSDIISLQTASGDGTGSTGTALPLPADETAVTYTVRITDGMADFGFLTANGGIQLRIVLGNIRKTIPVKANTVTL